LQRRIVGGEEGCPGLERVRRMGGSCAGEKVGPMKVEVHGHVLLPESFGAAGLFGPDLTETGDGRFQLRIGPYTTISAADPRKRTDLWDPAVKVEWMNASGIDKMLVTISPLWYLYWAEPEIAIPFASLNNDLLGKYCATASDRLFFAGTLPMQDIVASLTELKRLSAMGAKAVNIGTDDFGGRDLDNEAYWPLYEQLVANNLPIFLHPYPIPMLDGRVDNYNQSWVVGYIYQETAAFTHLTLGGVFDEFPDLQVYITHGGGFVPYQLGRIEAARTMKQPGVRAKQPVRHYLENNFYFDIQVHDLIARKFLVEFMGADRLVVGSNVGGWDNEDGFKLLDELNLGEAAHKKIAGTNAARLLNL